MKIQKLNQNHVSLQNSNIRVSKGNPQFTGGLSANAVRILEEIPGKKAIKIMDKLKYFKGERGGILFTAMGTGLVAPIFIAFNPFVRADKNATPDEKQEVRNTKMYTAMRQPISAVLAAIFQAGVLDYIDRGLDALTNNPKLAKYWDVIYDQSSLNKKEYIQRQVKKELKRSDFRNKKEYNEAVASRVEQIQKQQFDNIISKIKDEGKIVINGRDVPSDVMAQIINKQIDDYIKVAKELKIETNPEKTKSKMSGIDFYKQRASLLIKNEDEIVNLFDVKTDNKVLEYLKEASLDTNNKDFAPALKNILQSLEDNKSVNYDVNLVNHLKSIKTSDSETQTFLAKVIRLFEENNVEPSASGSFLKNEKQILNYLDENASVQNKEIKAIIKKITKSMNENQVLKFDRELLDYMKNAFSLSKDENFKKIVLEVIKNQIVRDKTELCNYLKNISNTSQNEDIKLLVNEILERDDVRVQSSRMKRTIDRIKKIKIACSGNFDVEKYGKYLEDGNAIIDQRIKELDELHIGTKVKKIKRGKDKISYKIPSGLKPEYIKNKIEALIKACKFEYKFKNTESERLQQLLGSSGIFSSNNEDLKSIICKDIAKGYKKYVENNYKGFGQISKVIIGVCITLPITCTALNWIYPRFMDLVFPNLGRSKTDTSKEAEKVNGGDK